ncbi:hypothetical protein WN55_10667 [Dufourea novaeangliae]|uniref:GRIP domain-containing protein n=1 Tax=Dufourea novaeangliae TaxID=178035 RepID=A0A154PB57_DUFNO|nr:hypothetical protein WN55_10667 [Dufourea novaeangliae]
MARHGTERSLNSLQSMHPSSSSHVNNNPGVVTPTELAASSPSSSATCTADDSGTKVNGDDGVTDTTGSAMGTIPSPSTPSVSSSSDSRIPRPSPTSLRRSSSMRMRGERVSPHQPPPSSPLSSTAVNAAPGRQHQNHRRLNFLQHQQHHHPDYRNFPVITENGTESPRQRSLSLSLTPARPRPGLAASGGSSIGIADDSDAESVRSYGSACSTASACDHATFAFNGTTWSGRSRKYVVHCSNHNGDNEQYLTPTQRAARQVRKFQALLKEARKEIEEKDQEIFRSTTPERDEERRKLVNLYEARIEEMHRRHVDELQELKQKHNDKVESLLNQLAEVNTRYCEMRPNVDAAEARARELETELEAVKAELAEQKTLLSEQEERNKHMYLKMYAKGQEAARIEQADQILEHAHQIPPKVSIAELLQQLTVTRAELENVKDTSYSPEPHISADRSQILLSAQEAVSLWVLGTRKVMYRRIIEARSQQGNLDPEITLQFLKSAIYYFLTDKENHQGHLNAIESILGFTEAEKHNIDRIYRSARK